MSTSKDTLKQWPHSTHYWNVTLDNKAIKMETMPSPMKGRYQVSFFFLRKAFIRISNDMPWVTDKRRVQMTVD